GFVVRLPLLEAVLEPREPPTSVQPRVPSRRVLVVDDNIDAATLLAEALEAHGYAVALAHDGPAALQIARSFEPEVALLDIGLPVMDGFELAQRLRAQMPEEPPLLIAISGYGQEADRERSRAAGFDAHFVKPADLDAIVARIEGSSSVFDQASAPVPTY
ncbi:MAG: response regulator, partial [Myxococcales bacterium]